MQAVSRLHPVFHTLHRTAAFPCSRIDKIRSGLARRKARILGAAVVEFALVLPVFLATVFMLIDLGLGIFTQAALDIGTAAAARDIQIGVIRGTDASQVRSDVCRKMPVILSSCSDLQVYATSGANFASLGPAAVSPTGMKPTTFYTGGAGSYVLLEVYLRRPFAVPAFEGSAGSNLVSAEAFQNEP